MKKRSSVAKPNQTKAETGYDVMHDVYGRRIEADRSWTIYHVFTGVPASMDGQALSGLGRAAATERMLAMNLRSSSRQTRPVHLRAPRLDADEIDVLEWR